MILRHPPLQLKFVEDVVLKMAAGQQVRVPFHPQYIAWSIVPKTRVCVVRF